MSATTSIEAAAEWWAEQLLGPTTFDNGDRSISGLFTTMLQEQIAEKHPVVNEQAEKFKTALVDDLNETGYRQHETGKLWVSLSVDYHPDRELRMAAEMAGISTSRFPIKTSMSITDDFVAAGLGYRAPYKLIWSRPDWERPTCQSPNGRQGTPQEIEQEHYWVSLPGLCGKPLFHEGDGDMGHGDWIPAALCVCGHTKDNRDHCWSRELGEHLYQATGPELP